MDRWSVLVLACSCMLACGAPAIEDNLPLRLPERTEDPAPSERVPPSVKSSAVTEPPSARANDTDAAAPPPMDAGADVSAATQSALLCGAPDLALCFSFEGAVTDLSPNKVVPTVTGVSFVPGQVGMGASLDATSAIRFAASPVLELTTATIEARVKLAPNPSGDGVIFDDDNRASLTILQNGNVLCKPNAAAVSAPIVAGQWTHVACVFDGARAHVYVDGSERGSGAAAIPSSPASTAAMGGNAPSGEPFVGVIDSLRVFRVARTPAQIAAAAVK